MPWRHPAEPMGKFGLAECPLDIVARLREMGPALKMQRDDRRPLQNPGGFYPLAGGQGEVPRSNRGNPGSAHEEQSHPDREASPDLPEILVPYRIPRHVDP